MSKSFKKEQERIKRWYEKGFTAVYKKDCQICGNVFYALFNNQIACPNGICDEKLKSMQNSSNKE